MKVILTQTIIAEFDVEVLDAMRHGTRTELSTDKIRVIAVPVILPNRPNEHPPGPTFTKVITAACEQTLADWLVQYTKEEADKLTTEIPTQASGNA